MIGRHPTQNVEHEIGQVSLSEDKAEISRISYNEGSRSMHEHQNKMKFHLHMHNIFLR